MKVVLNVEDLSEINPVTREKQKDHIFIRIDFSDKENEIYKKKDM